MSTLTINNIMLPNYLKIVKLFVSVFLNLLAETPARISPKENSGASGGFLPKPLLLRLQHPNSKTNQPKFWQILSSPKNSFAKTSSALVPPLARSIEGRVPQKNALILLEEKIGRAQKQNSGEHFSVGYASGASGGGADSLCQSFRCENAYQQSISRIYQASW